MWEKRCVRSTDRYCLFFILIYLRAYTVLILLSTCRFVFYTHANGLFHVLRVNLNLKAIFLFTEKPYSSEIRYKSYTNIGFVIKIVNYKSHKSCKSFKNYKSDKINDLDRYFYLLRSFFSLLF